MITMFRIKPHFNRASTFLSPHASTKQGVGSFDYLVAFYDKDRVLLCSTELQLLQFCVSNGKLLLGKAY